jgi:hypothetical protein
MAFKARKEGICIYCNGKIFVNDPVAWLRIVGEGEKTYHVACNPHLSAGAIDTTLVTTSNGNGTNGATATLPAAPAASDKVQALIDAATAIINDRQTAVTVPAELDEKKIREIARAAAIEAAASVTRTIEIKNEDKPIVKLESVHHKFELLLKLVTSRNKDGQHFNVYLSGDAGGGKSTAAHQVADALGVEYGYCAVNPQTPESRFLGYMNVNGEYVPTQWFYRFTEGGVFCIDEADLGSNQILGMLNGMIANGIAAFPHGMFKRHKDFILIITGNTNGRGGTILYPDRRALDTAFLDRFEQIEWDLDRGLITSTVEAIFSGDKQKAADLMYWVGKTGADLTARHPQLIITPRAYFDAAALTVQGFNQSDIASMAIARGVK